MSKLEAFIKAGKNESLVVGPVERYLITKSKKSGNSHRWGLYPSEICKTDWCPRQSYYRLSDEPFEEPTTTRSRFPLDKIFAEGNESGRRWQNWLWEMKVLWGEWECLFCKNRWMDNSPDQCPFCRVEGKELLRYKEIPLEDKEHIIVGHADGGLGEFGVLVENKTVGKGTIRIEEPDLLKTHTYQVNNKTVYDLESIWKELRRPFASHMKQGQIYLHMRSEANPEVLFDERIVFVYDFKQDQTTKEFVVRYNPKIIEDILSSCLDIKQSLELKQPPSRPIWASVDNSTCKGCVYMKTCWDINDENIGTITSSNTSKGRTRARKTTPTRATPIQVPEITLELNGLDGHGSDELIRPTNSIHKLLRGPTRSI